jgi:PadR family transcriptional regulator PadR
MRLADRGLLETAWERDPPPGRPPRHLYRLTGPGRVLAGSLATDPPGQPTPARAGRRIRRRPRLEGT